MKISKSHPNCQKCMLFNGCSTPWMESAGSEEPIVLVIGEAPGENEDKVGEPFVGRSGKLLRSTLEDAGLDIDKDVRFTNVVKCRPPDNKITKKAIDLCKHFVADEIAFYEPQLVMLLGNTPLNAILGESGITTWNGVVVERDEATYVPLYHPAYILRNPDAGGDWIDGIDRALDVLANGVTKQDWEYIYPDTPAAIDEMVKWLSKQDLIAYDTETSSLDPFAIGGTVPCVSFAAGNRSYVPAIPTQISSQSNAMQKAVYSAIKAVLNRPGARIIGHNIKFDQNHTRRILGVEFDAYGDTMLVSHMLDSRQGIHGLKRLAGLYLGMYDYDKELNDYIAEHIECNVHKGGSYANIPLEILRPYAAKDAQATLLLWHKLFPQLSEKQQHLFLEMVMGASNTLAKIEYNGNAIDQYVAERYVQLYKMEQQRLMDMLLADKKVQHTVKVLQDKADAALIDGLPEGSIRIVVKDDYIAYAAPTKSDAYREGKRKRTKIIFNPNSSDHLKQLYFKEYKIPKQGMTDSGEPSTSAKVMAPMIAKYPIVKNVVYYRLLTKMLGTYLEPAANGEWSSGDGRVRSTYNLHGTRTSRLSSSNPNMQNIPTPEKEADNNPMSITVWVPIKNIFTHSWWEAE